MSGSPAWRAVCRRIDGKATITVLGYPQAELKDHIRGALNVGCTPDDILETILQMAVYAGFPAALEAVKTAASVFSNKQ
jgi:4-carboxymuconolactone decarboxylase